MAIDWNQDEIRRLHRAGYSFDTANLFQESPLYGGHGGGGGGVTGSGWTSPFVPMEAFLDEGEFLTTSNFSDTLRKAHDAAIASTNGYRIGIPATPQGVDYWPVTGQFLWPGRGEGLHSITWVGAGKGATILQWNEIPTGGCIRFDGIKNTSGTEQAGLNVFYGGLENMTIRSAPVASWSDLPPESYIGIYFRAAVMQYLLNVQVSFFGTAIYVTGNDLTTTPLIPVFNVQNQNWDAVKIQTCRRGLWMRSNSVFRIRGLDINDCQAGDVISDSYNGGTFDSCMFQSAGVTHNSFSCSSNYQGADEITFVGQTYHEGNAVSFLSVPAKLGSTYLGYPSAANAFYVQQLVWNGTYTTAFDVVDLSTLAIGAVRGSATKLVKARLCAAIEISAGPDPVTSNVYDLDNASSNGFRVGLTNAFLSYDASRSRSDTVAGVLWNAAHDMWHPSIQSSVTVSGKEISAIRGIKAGLTMTTASGANPYFTRSSVALNGKAIIRTVKSDNRNMDCVLSTPVPVGSYLGMFAILRAPDSSTGDAGYRGPVVTNSTTDSVGIALNDSTAGAHVGAVYYGAGVGSTWNGPNSDTKWHAVLINGTGLRDPTGGSANTFEKLYVDTPGSYASSGTSAATSTSPVAWLSLSNEKSSAGAHAAARDLEIAFLAVLSRALTPGEIEQLFAAAQTEFGLSRVAGPTAAPDGLVQYVSTEGATDGQVPILTGGVPVWGTAGGSGGSTYSSFAWASNAATLTRASVFNVFSASNTLTGNSTLTLTGFSDGDSGRIYVVQDATGGRTISFTVSGRTITADANSLDDSPASGPNAITAYDFEFITLNSVARVRLVKVFLS